MSPSVTSRTRTLLSPYSNYYHHVSLLQRVCLDVGVNDACNYHHFSTSYSDVGGEVAIASLVITIILSASYSHLLPQSFPWFLVITIILSASYSSLSTALSLRRLVITIILSASYSPSKTTGLPAKGWYSSDTCETRSILSQTSPLPVISAFSLPRHVLQCFRSTPPLWRLATDSS